MWTILTRWAKYRVDGEQKEKITLRCNNTAIEYRAQIITKKTEFSHAHMSNSVVLYVYRVLSIAPMGAAQQPYSQLYCRGMRQRSVIECPYSIHVLIKDHRYSSPWTSENPSMTLNRTTLTMALSLNKKFFYSQRNEKCSLRTNDEKNRF